MEMRTRLLSVMFAVGLVSSLPNPVSSQPLGWNLLLLALWIFSGALAWAAWYRVDLLTALWSADFVLASLGFWRFRLLLPMVLIVLWGLWLRTRTLREFSERKGIRTLIFLLALALSSASNRAFAQKDAALNASLSVLPAYLSGYKLNDLVSCGAVDQIPWKFRPDGHKTRLILKDTLRHQSETSFATWEVHQIMDKEGFISFVFRHALANGRYDSIITKDTVYNRVIDTAKGPKLTESQDLRSLINRSALIFYHVDGGTIAYSPSSVGKSALIIQLARSPSGRLLPPIFLRANICDKPEDEENSDSTGKKIAPASAGSTGGSSSTSATTPTTASPTLPGVGK